MTKATKTPDMVRQGDVLLIAIDAIPDTAKPAKIAKNRPPELAYGETSGHSHGLYGKAKMFCDTGSGSGITVLGGKPITDIGFTGQFAELLKDVAVTETHDAMLGHGTPTDAVTLPRDPDHGAIPVSGTHVAIRQREFPRKAPMRQVAD